MIVMIMMMSGHFPPHDKDNVEAFNFFYSDDDDDVVETFFQMTMMMTMMHFLVS